MKMIIIKSIWLCLFVSITNVFSQWTQDDIDIGGTIVCKFGASSAYDVINDYVAVGDFEANNGEGLVRVYKKSTGLQIGNDILGITNVIFGNGIGERLGISVDISFSGVLAVGVPAGLGGSLFINGEVKFYELESNNGF